METLAPELLHLFLKETLYVVTDPTKTLLKKPTNPEPSQVSVQVASQVSTEVSSLAQRVTSSVASVNKAPAIPALPATPAIAAANPGAIPALPATPGVAAAPAGPILPAFPPRALAILVHQPTGPLAGPLHEMLQKLATAAEPNAALHVVLAQNMEPLPWPTTWHPWAPRLTLLLGWPAPLLARNRIAEPMQLLRFGTAKIIAAPHPADFCEDKAVKAQLWALIKSAG